MRQRRALVVRVTAGLAVALASVFFAISGTGLKAQNPSAEPPPPSVPPTEPNDDAPAISSLPPRNRDLPLPSSPALADPEGEANAFVARSTRDADAAIAALAKEANSLRARLRKVEAGLSRWQAVKAALKSHNGLPSDRELLVPGTVVSPPIESSNSAPTQLEPIDRGDFAHPKPPLPVIVEPKTAPEIEPKTGVYEGLKPPRAEYIKDDLKYLEIPTSGVAAPPPIIETKPIPSEVPAKK